MQQWGLGGRSCDIKAKDRQGIHWTVVSPRKPASQTSPRPYWTIAVCVESRVGQAEVRGSSGATSERAIGCYGCALTTNFGRQRQCNTLLGCSFEWTRCLSLTGRRQTEKPVSQYGVVGCEENTGRGFMSRVNGTMRASARVRTKTILVVSD